MQNGTPAKLFLYNIKTGRTEMEHAMRTKEPVDQKSVHGQFRNVRMTKSGTYLIAHMNLGKVIEYDKDWKEIWSCARAVGLACDAVEEWQYTDQRQSKSAISTK